MTRENGFYKVWIKPKESQVASCVVMSYFENRWFACGDPTPYLDSDIYFIDEEDSFIETRNLSLTGIICETCGELFNPANLTSTLSHLHDKTVEPAHAIGIKGHQIQKIYGENESTNVSRIGYDSRLSIMQIEFRNHKKYDYIDVPKEVFDKAILARSIGSFIAREIKGNYRYEFSETKGLKKE